MVILPLSAALLYLVLLTIAASCFCKSDCLLFGPEQIVGTANVGYHDDGSFYYTNPFAMLFRHALYLLLTAAVTWLAAVGCESPRLHLFPHSAGVKTNMRRLLLACLFAGIFIGIGSGILALTCRWNADLWRSVRSLDSPAQYETHFGRAKYHLPEVTEENFKQIVQNRRMCDREFALGKELHVFSSAWPFRLFFVWQEEGRIVRITWRGGW